MSTSGQVNAGQSQGASSPQREPVIQVRNLVKRFDGRTVLDGLNVDIYPGETVVIMGGSGCGKTTFLRCLIGAIKADEGQVRMLGRNLAGLDERGMDEVRKQFGILFQSGALFNSMSLSQNVALPLEEHTDLGREIIDIQVKMKLELVGLREHAEKLPSQISGGMKKRAGLARAMALDPKILFYDEPSAGLDPVTSAEIDQLIINLTRGLGVTSVVVTHEMDSAFTIADRMVMLDKGRCLKVESREWFDRLRKLTDEQAAALSTDERIIRQFLRGDAHGPITERRGTGSYADDLLGAQAD
ncbi:MAG: ATP-binding cassette domain-containing protein [Phycisphaeraceae bacterium]|nr:ATP-binding cassette domain-containing protein [Phycisphaeraceae bacterium]